MFGNDRSKNGVGSRRSGQSDWLSDTAADPLGRDKQNEEYPFYPMPNSYFKTYYKNELDKIRLPRWQDAYKSKLHSASSEDERNVVYQLAFEKSREEYLQKKGSRSGGYFGDPDEPNLRKRLWDRYQTALSNTGNDPGKKFAAVAHYHDPFTDKSKMKLKPDKLEGIDPGFRGKVERILERMRARGYDAYVREGMRTLSEQKDNVKRGVSKTLKSEHLTGKAVDIVSSSKAWRADPGFWDALASEAEREGLFWGGNWKGLVDKAHVQLEETGR